jgi:hypothetical protein
VKKPNFLRPREKFLILEISPKGTNGLFLSVDEDRTINFEKFARNINLKKFFKSPVRLVTQKSWEGQHIFKKSRRRVIASADPSLATTIPIPLDLTRESGYSKSEITLPEMENLIAQAMGKIFNQCRNEAARRLNLHEIDTILVGAKTKDFKVDGKSVVNPAGFTGKKLTLLLELTFTTRDIFEDLKQFFNSPEDFFFAEAPQTRLFSLARGKKLPMSLIVADDTDAALFVLERAKGEHAVLYREKLDWNFNTLFNTITKEYGVSEKMARELYRGYLRGHMSEAAKRIFKKTIQPALSHFLNSTDKAKLQGFVYIDAPHELPFEFPYKWGSATFAELPLQEVLSQLDFQADLKNFKTPAGVLSRHLLPFIEAYFDRSNSGINKKLRRRLHWLAS